MNPQLKNKISKLQQKNPARKTSSNKIGSWVWIGLAAVTIATIAIYFDALKFKLLYTWDDQLYIRANNDIKYLHWENIKLFFTKYYAGNYQPLTMLLYAMEFKAGLGETSIFHLNNIFLHILNTFLVFILIRKISPNNDMVALITAAFFAVHPMHVESVAWIAERKDVLYSFFFLLSLIMYTTYIKSKRRKLLLYVGVFFFLSCLSKSAAVVLPLIMLLLDYYLNRKYTWKTIAEKIPFFLISLIFGVVAIYSQKGSSAIQNMAPAMTTVEHISIVSFSFISYLLKAFFPVKLSAIYTYPVELGTTLPLIYYLSILLVVLLLIFVWHSNRWGKDIIFGFLFFIVTIILVLQFIPVGAAAMADRYTYIPYIGVFFIIGKVYEKLSLKFSSKINYTQNSSIVLVSIFVVFSTISYARVKVWEKDETLFSDVINKYSNSHVAYNCLGVTALGEYVNSSNVGNDNIRKPYIDNALKDFDKAIEINPKYSTAYNNRGTAKFNLRDYTGAISDYNKAIEINDTYEDAFTNRGMAKNSLNDFAGAVKDFDMALKINPGYADAYTSRGYSRLNLKDYDGALEDYNKVVQLNPQDANAINRRNAVISIIEDAKK